MEITTLKLLLVPAILAFGGSVLAVIGAAANPSPRRRSLLGILALFILAVSAWALSWWPLQYPAGLAKLTADPLALYACLAALLAGILGVLVAFNLPQLDTAGEFFAMILFSVLGLVMTGIAADLLVLFLALELSSIPGFILVGLSRRHPLTEEAAAKYFFLGALATCLTAFGLVFLYGAAGTMNIAVCLTQSNWLVLVGLLITFAGLAFKTTVVPFYFYAPDVYQGTPAAATAIIAVLPKLTGFIALVKILAFIGFTSPVWTIFWPLLWAVAAVTVTAGNVLALLQSDLKRILAYSSIAHSGYMLIGLAAAAGLPGGLQNGLAAVLFYILIYSLMSLGSFGALGHFGNESARLKDLAGLAKTRPAWSLLFAFFILSLTGLPPTAGFWAKLYIFAAALGQDNQWLIFLAVLGLLNAAVAAAYYFRIIAWLYSPTATDSSSSDTTPSGLPGAVPFGLTLIALLILLIGLLPGKLIHIAESAAKALIP